MRSARIAPERRGQAAAQLDAEHALPRPVDVAEVEQQRGLVEREADPGPERHRQRPLEPGVVGDQSHRAGAEGDQYPGNEMVDVAAAQTNVPERPPAAADPGRREPHEREAEDEPGKQVEQHCLVARRGLVTLDRHRDRVLSCPPRGPERLLGRLDHGGGCSDPPTGRTVRRTGRIRPPHAPARQPRDLGDQDAAGGGDRQPGEADGQPVGATPITPTPEPLNQPAHSRTRFSALMPRVTPRKSTTRAASRTTRS